MKFVSYFFTLVTFWKAVYERILPALSPQLFSQIAPLPQPTLKLSQSDTGTPSLTLHYTIKTTPVIL